MASSDYPESGVNNPQEQPQSSQNDAKVEPEVQITQTTSAHDDESTIQLEKWNEPRVNTYRYGVTNISLFVQGMHDACLGALIPYIEIYYNVNYTTISTVFLVSFVGSMIAAMSNNRIHYATGQRGVAFLAPLSRLIGYIILIFHPPFPLLPIALLIASFGNCLADSAYNAWIGNMDHANELLSIIQAVYGLGATISPLIASAMVTKANLEWYAFFYILIGLSVLEFTSGMWAFWRATGAAYRARLHSGGGEGGSETETARVTTRAVLKLPITWLISVLLLGYVGVEVSLGGWIVTFMLKVRHADKFLAGLTVTLFWLGITLGRACLGFVTGRLGEKLAISIYLSLAVVLELLYWLVPHFVAAVVFVTLLGFFLGPLFPAAIVVATKLMPVDQHVSAIGFASAFGGGGAAVLPFLVGVVAERRGVSVLHPFSLAFFIFIALIWVVLPGGFKKGGLEKARKTNEKPGESLLLWVSEMRAKRSRSEDTTQDQAV